MLSTEIVSEGIKIGNDVDEDGNVVDVVDADEVEDIVVGVADDANCGAIDDADWSSCLC